MTEATSGLLANKVTVTLTDTAVIIRRGLVSPVERSIPLRSISEVAYKAGLTGKGYIEFVAPGVDGRVSFSYWKKDEFAALKRAVDEQLQQRG